MRTTPRAAVVVATVGLILMSTIPALAALPSTDLTRTDMVNGTVRALAQVGSDIWIAGDFTEVLDASQSPIASVRDLVAFNASGQLDTSITYPTFTSSSGTDIVYGLSYGPDGNLYAAGTFTAVEGQTRNGVAAIDPSNGTLVTGFHPNAGSSKSVLATASAIYVGAAKLRSFQLNGTATPGFTPPTAHTDPNLRAHKTLPAFRGLALSAGRLVATCQCDSMDDGNGNGHPVKAIVEIDPSTGDLLSWSPSDLGPGGTAFGITPLIHNAPGTGAPTIYVAAGGNDWAAAYDLVSGQRVWHEDCSGSCQGITWFQNDLIVGGHFDWMQKPGGPLCGDDAKPNTNCYLSPHLVALDPSNGHPILVNGSPWNPGICCHYNGVWVVLADTNGTTLHVGGEFTKAGAATWTYNASAHKYTMKGGIRQDYYARFDAPLGNQTLTVNKTGGGNGTVTSNPTGISCGSTCSHAFTGNSSVTLTAKAAVGSSFVGWSGDCSGTGTCHVVMSGSRSVTAAFSSAPPHTLNVTKLGAGSGTVTSSPSGIACPGTCSASFAAGSVVTLSHHAAAGSSFGGWSGDCSGTGTCKLTMSATRNVGADFVKGKAGCGKIAFASGRAGNGDIFTMNPNGSGLTNLTKDPGAESSPAWSPDCSRVAFVGRAEGGHAHIFVMDADGTAMSQVTTGAANDTEPTWAPGGQRLAFVSDRSDHRQLYSIGVNGSGLTRLTKGSWADVSPDWSPKGNLIVFASNRFGHMDLYTVHPDGSHRTRLTQGTRPFTQPEWSPNGSRIAVISAASGSPQVWVMDANGSGRTKVTKDGKTDSHPAWAPLGTRIAYASTRSGNLDIWVIDTNGTGAVNVTKNGAKDTAPTWR